MGKKVSGKRNRTGGDTEAWSASDHLIRKAKQELKQNQKQEERARRSALLTRDSKEKREEGKLRLHIKRVQRQLDKLRERLESWDDVEEKRLLEQLKAEEERKRQEALEPKKKKGRKGPETWKLKGAARPAWQVYDFDTRYVDPHIKAHEEAKKKAKRCRNILSTCKGKFGEEEKGVPQPHCREFLSLLMQLGNLARQANQLKTARQAFLECIELDSSENPVTPARCQLMRLYMDANRPDSARRLWERLPSDDPSVWIRYSAALVEYVSWKLLGEEGSSQETAETLLTRAIRANVFCAYYLGFFDTFSEVMDYVDEIEDADEEQPLEEAIEYCNSEQMGAWQGTDGAMEWVRDFVLSGLHSHSVSDEKLSSSDLEWRDKLSEIRRDYEASEGQSNRDIDESGGLVDNDSDPSEDNDSVADVAMFAGMFETAMEMLEEEGKLMKKNDPED